MSSQRILSEFLSTFKALNVISSKFPIGVETIYKPDKKLFIKNEKNYYYIFILFIDLLLILLFLLLRTIIQIFLKLEF